MKKNANHRLIAGLLAAGLILTGCGKDNDELPSAGSLEKASPYARFDPAGGVIPFPNNLLFTGSEDGTLNIPVVDPDNYSDPQVAMNALDGFSTLTSFTAQMSAPVDPASVRIGENVRVFQVALHESGAVTGILRELAAGVEYVAGVSPVDANTISVTPLAPLAPQSGYLVTLGQGLQSTTGEAYTSELYYALAQSGAALVDETGHSLYAGLSDEDALQLEPLRQLTNIAEGAVEGYTVTADATDSIPDQSAADIILSWSFRTQSIGASLSAIAGAVTAQPLQTASAGITTADANPALRGLADIHIGSLDVPYYSGIPSQEDPAAPLTGFWRAAGGGYTTAYNPMPVATGTQTIPVLMTLPNADSGQTMPAAGWPVVIFQHGIGQNRTHLLAIADTLAAAGFAGIAIDLPLHGIADSAHPLSSANNPLVDHERTFGLDVINNETKLPGQDGLLDPSGVHFINLINLLATRDNVRQGAADLMTLTASLGSVTGLDASNVRFVGHSLGAMVGTAYLAHTPAAGAAVLGFPGGGFAKLLDGSATFGPEIAAGLSAKGVLRGTPDYEAFMLAAQTVVDTADPINHASAAVTGRGLLMFEVVGSENSSLPDQVVPNNVVAAAPEGVILSPTAGTDPLGLVMGLTRYGQTPAGDGTALDAWVRFTAGHHGSLVTPADAQGSFVADSLDARTYAEMHGQMASFLVTGGTALSIADTAVVEQP